MSQSPPPSPVTRVEVPDDPARRARPLGALLRPARDCWRIFFISADQGAVSHPRRHRDPRVGPRRPPPARLPLPLSAARRCTDVLGRFLTCSAAFLVRGLLAGLLAGFAAFLVAYQVGEPHVERAIALEEAGAADATRRRTTHAAEADGTTPTRTTAPSVSRDNQRTWGLLTGTLAVGVALGGLVALVAAGRRRPARPAQRRASPRRWSPLVGFVAVALVPFLKYPATPPAVGNADTIGDRTALYFALPADLGRWPRSLARRARPAAARAVRRRTSPSSPALRPTSSSWSSPAWLMPTVNEVGDFPADTLWYFRRAVAPHAGHACGRRSASCSPAWSAGCTATGRLRAPRRELAASL